MMKRFVGKTLTVPKITFSKPPLKLASKMSCCFQPYVNMPKNQDEVGPKGNF